MECIFIWKLPPLLGELATHQCKCPSPSRVGDSRLFALPTDGVFDCREYELPTCLSLSTDWNSTRKTWPDWIYQLFRFYFGTQQPNWSHVFRFVMIQNGDFNICINNLYASELQVSKQSLLNLLGCRYMIVFDFWTRIKWKLHVHLLSFRNKYNDFTKTVSLYGVGLLSESEFNNLNYNL